MIDKISLFSKQEENLKEIYENLEDLKLKLVVNKTSGEVLSKGSLGSEQFSSAYQNADSYTINIVKDKFNSRGFTLFIEFNPFKICKKPYWNQLTKADLINAINIIESDLKECNVNIDIRNLPICKLHLQKTLTNLSFETHEYIKLFRSMPNVLYKKRHPNSVYFDLKSNMKIIIYDKKKEYLSNNDSPQFILPEALRIEIRMNTKYNISRLFRFRNLEELVEDWELLENSYVQFLNSNLLSSELIEIIEASSSRLNLYDVFKTRCKRGGIQKYLLSILGDFADTDFIFKLLEDLKKCYPDDTRKINDFKKTLVDDLNVKNTFDFYFHSKQEVDKMISELLSNLN